MSAEQCKGDVKRKDGAGWGGLTPPPEKRRAAGKLRAGGDGALGNEVTSSEDRNGVHGEGYDFSSDDEVYGASKRPCHGGATNGHRPDTGNASGLLGAEHRICTPPMYTSLDDVIHVIRKARKILVLTGAGVSVSCGIPDFRSANGLYSKLRVSYPDLPCPEAMFDKKFFLTNPMPFFHFAKEIFPGNFQPSLTHRFIKMLETKDKLLRNYTQNIDTLESVAGVNHVVYCHGNFATASCMRCLRKVPSEDIREDIFAQRIPLCPMCLPVDEFMADIGQLADLPALASPDVVEGASLSENSSAETETNTVDGVETEATVCGGHKTSSPASSPVIEAPQRTACPSPVPVKSPIAAVDGVDESDEVTAEEFGSCSDNDMLHSPKLPQPHPPPPVMKPDITFFGEDLPPTFYSSVEKDLPSADLLIVMGSSMKVSPVCHIPTLLHPSVPRLLINKQPIRTEYGFQLELLGDCDSIIGLLMDGLGYDKSAGVPVASPPARDHAACSQSVAGPARPTWSDAHVTSDVENGTVSETTCTSAVLTDSPRPGLDSSCAPTPTVPTSPTPSQAADADQVSCASSEVSQAFSVSCSESDSMAVQLPAPVAASSPIRSPLPEEYESSACLSAAEPLVPSSTIQSSPDTCQHGNAVAPSSDGSAASSLDPALPSNGEAQSSVDGMDDWSVSSVSDDDSEFGRPRRLVKLVWHPKNGRVYDFFEPNRLLFEGAEVIVDVDVSSSCSDSSAGSESGSASGRVGCSGSNASDCLPVQEISASDLDEVLGPDMCTDDAADTQGPSDAVDLDRPGKITLDEDLPNCRSEKFEELLGSIIGQPVDSDKPPVAGSSLLDSSCITSSTPTGDQCDFDAHATQEHPVLLAFKGTGASPPADR